MLAASAALLAAGVAGEWKATAEGPNGSMERTLSLKVDGNKLTGETVSSFVGKSTIEDGKVDGDKLSFTIKISFQGNEMSVKYSGKLTGDDTMDLTSELGEGQTIDWKAKRSK